MSALHAGVEKTAAHIENGGVVDEAVIAYRCFSLLIVVYRGSSLLILAYRCFSLLIFAYRHLSLYEIFVHGPCCC